MTTRMFPGIRCFSDRRQGSVRRMSVLITGACGSLGRALLRHALAAGVDRLVAYDQDELGTYLTRERLGQPPAVRWLVGDVCDRERLERAMWGVEAVIHCAARKWVASGVANIDEVIRVNVTGTQAVLDAARRAHVARVLVITSDKAVHPTTSYGATKLLAEQMAVQANGWSFPQGTASAALRLGNLLWSRGSVAHRWRQAAAAGKPLQLTASGMTRYGIRLSAAADLAWHCVEVLQGGEIFVPALAAYRLEELAAAIAPAEDWVLTGNRGPGEKRHELLLSDGEQARAVWVPSIPAAVLEPEAPTWTRPGWTGEPVPDTGWDSGTAEPMTDWAFDELDDE